MIKILFFIPGLSGGGAEKVLCNLVNNMDQSKFDITVQTVDYYNPDKYLVPGIHYKSIFYSKSRFMKKILNLWYRFCTEVGLTYPLYIKGEYNIEVAYLECGATKVMSASTNKNAIKLAWVHCDIKKRALIVKKSGPYYKKFDKVVCVSNEAKKSFDEIFGECAKSVVLYNIIDDDEILYKINEKEKLNWNSEDKHLLTVGRLSYEKGCDRMIKVCKMLKDAGYKFKMHFLGDGPEKTVLQDQVNKLNLKEYVMFEGVSTNPYLYMKESDIIVIPSRTEALSTVAIESLILGKPVVTTPCAGMKELFGNSVYALVTEDTIDSLYVGIRNMLDSVKLREKYAMLAKKRSKVFKKSNLIKQTENFFVNQLNRKNIDE